MTREELELLKSHLGASVRFSAIPDAISAALSAAEYDPSTDQDLNPHLSIISVCRDAAVRATEACGVQTSTEDVLLMWLTWSITPYGQQIRPAGK